MSLEVRGSFDLGKIRRAPREIAPEALAEAMEHIRVVAVGRTPVETGHLAGSAEVKVDAERMEASLSYPGPYARYQHERLDLRHETGQAKYLESALSDGVGQALKVIERRLKGAM